MEDGPALQGATFAYGIKYLERSTALEIDPVGLSLQDKTAVRGKILLPPDSLALFGGIRDAAPRCLGPSSHRIQAESSGQQPSGIDLPRWKYVPAL
jgi:hypothetical protein